MIPQDELNTITEKADELMAILNLYTLYAVASGHNSAGAHHRRQVIRDLVIALQSNAYLHGLDHGLEVKYNLPIDK